jgi:hypothetical protein
MPHRESEVKAFVGKSFGIVAAVMLSAGIASAAQATDSDLDRPVSDSELRELANAYAGGDLGSARCDWVHPVTEGPTRIPCEVVPLPVLADMAGNVLNKHAQFELAKRFEEGRGVQQDYAMARRWYRMAARDARRESPVVGAEPAGFSVSGIGGQTIYARRRAVGMPEAEEPLRSLSTGD